MYIPTFDETEKNNYKLLEKIANSDWPLSSDFFSSCNGNPSLILSGIQEVINDTFTQILSIKNTVDFWILLAQLHKSGVDALFLPDVIQNIFQANSEIHLLLYQSGITLPPDYYSNQTIVNNLADYILATFILSPITGFTQNDKGKVAFLVNNIIKFEQSLAEKMRNSPFPHSLSFTSYSAFQAQANLSIDPYFTFLGVKLNANSLVALMESSYFTYNGFPSVLASTELVTYQYYLLWRVFLKYYQLGFIPVPVYSNSKLEQMKLKDPRALKTELTFFNNQKLPSSPLMNPNKKAISLDQPTQCLYLLNSFLGDFIGHLFSEEILNDEILNDIRQLTAEIKNAFRGGLNNLDWLDYQGKLAITYKLDHIIQAIGHPNVLATYRGVLLSPYPQDFAFNLEYIYYFNLNRRMKSIGKLFDRSNYNFDATIVNAFYMAMTNSIRYSKKLCSEIILIVHPFNKVFLLEFLNHLCIL